MHLKKELEKKFGANCFEYGLFYHYKNALRFELSPPKSSSRIKSFLTAYNKAEEILNNIFHSNKSFTICLSFTGEENLISNLTFFKNLKDNDISIPKQVCYWTKIHKEENPELEYRRCFLLFKSDDKDILYKLLWGSLAKDMYIFPRLYSDVYIYDLKKGIIVQPYDDRGMDIIGTDHTYMQNLYHKFSKYLFDYDMKKMLNVFE